MVEFRRVRGHIEVYRLNQFWFSADTIQEARQEIREDENPGDVGVV